MVWPPVQPPSDAGRLSGSGEGVRRRRRSGVRLRLQRDRECSGEVGVSATIDGWDQGQGKEGLRRLPGVRGQRQRQRQRQERGDGASGLIRLIRLISLIGLSVTRCTSSINQTEYQFIKINNNNTERLLHKRWKY